MVSSVVGVVSTAVDSMVIATLVHGRHSPSTSTLVPSISTSSKHCTSTSASAYFLGFLVAFSTSAYLKTKKLKPRKKALKLVLH